MILYKKDTKGKIRYLKIYTKGAELIQESGVVDTDKPIEHIKTCKGKNIGRSNETTPSEQAISEMNSKIEEKLTEGYFKTLDECNTIDVVLPMLAKDYKEENHKIDWAKGVYVQPKMDGMRCLASVKDGKVILMSRQGKEITTVKHINDDLAKYMSSDMILDGELYYSNSFQENMTLIKKYRSGETEKVKFHVYDMINQKPFKDRIFSLEMIVNNISCCIPVKTHLVKSEEALKQMHSLFISEGFEGTIVRIPDSKYKVNGRSSDLLKYKDFKDIALKIHDVIPADQRPNWGQFIFYWKGAKGHPYGDDYIGCGMKFSHEERKEFLENKDHYIDKVVELRFFEYTDIGSPRFPIAVGIRLDK